MRLQAYSSVTAAAGNYPLDPDSDNDGAQDGTDAFPLNPNEQLDTDGVMAAVTMQTRTQTTTGY